MTPASSVVLFNSKNKRMCLRLECDNADGESGACHLLLGCVLEVEKKKRWVSGARAHTQSCLTFKTVSNYLFFVPTKWKQYIFFSFFVVVL